ncbi:hypothetical protein PR048_018362 [Dryococelus australis]|uniref:HAT C-terminal dimerisation domain-containing protein n=1 Tax=Dryococelus australis TaxID=614101 RepID=A0ABQ9HC64_9NEOP|nr:hypothetical protein PR048_018362 [Dryococelus australis]
MEILAGERTTSLSILRPGDVWACESLILPRLRLGTDRSVAERAEGARPGVVIAVRHPRALAAETSSSRGDDMRRLPSAAPAARAWPSRVLLTAASSDYQACKQGALWHMVQKVAYLTISEVLGSNIFELRGQRRGCSFAREGEWGERLARLIKKKWRLVSRLCGATGPTTKLQPAAGSRVGATLLASRDEPVTAHLANNTTFPHREQSKDGTRHSPHVNIAGEYTKNCGACCGECSCWTPGANTTRNSTKARLLGLCETRFIGCHEAVDTFVELLPAIVPSLRDLSQCNRTFLSTASSLLAAMEKGNFIVALYVCEYLFSLTLLLYSYLHNPQHDLALYRDRLRSRPRGIIIPTNLLNSTISDIFSCHNLQQPFCQNKDILSALEILLTKHAHENCPTSQVAVKSEYLLWWKGKRSDVPIGIMSILDACSKHFFLTIHHLLCILATLPVSTSEVEMSFFSLKRIKTYLRNSMCSERLTGLALMAIHYPLPFTANDVLDWGSRSSNTLKISGLLEKKLMTDKAKIAYKQV